MENSYFDKLFRDKLGNLEDSERAGSWELLQHRMAADPELSSPGETADPIDEIVKSKLEGTSASYEPGFWAMMEDKIDADVDLNPQIDNVVFDGIVYENLNNLETPFDPSHWELMAKRIQEEFSLQHRLYKYKVAEIGLMLLAIFTLLQFLPIDKMAIAKNDNAANKTEVSSEIQPAFAEATTELDQTKTVRDDNTVVTNNSIATNKKIDTAIGPIVIPNLLAAAKKEGLKNTATENTLPDYTKLNNIGTSANAPIENTLPLVTTLSGVDNQDEIETLATDDHQQLSITESLHINSSEMDLLTYNDSENLPQCTHCKRKKPVYIRTGMFVATDLNYTMTPYDDKFEQNAYATLSAGYTGGLSFSVQQGRWEIGSAVHYSSIKYAPKQNVEYTGSLRDGLVGEGLKSAQINILSIPLNINYTYASAGKWKLYAVAGGSANMAVINHFDTKKFSVGSSRGGNLDPRIKDPHAEPTPSYSGVFEGGSIQNNIYFTANLGLGAERYLTPRWSVFVQPVYQHSLLAKGLGPNSDRFNTFSIFAGAKATLR